MKTSIANQQTDVTKNKVGTTGNDLNFTQASETTLVEKAISKDLITNTVTINWYVITGGPGSGKTSTINLLKARGFKTTIEHARHYLDTQLVQGKTVEEVRRNQQAFQLGILEMQMEQEALLSPNDVVFLDRAMPDALAYYRFLHITVDERLINVLESVSYKKVFILDCLPLVQDYARPEDRAAQQKIHELLIEVYSSLPFPIISVPVLSLEERVDFILEGL